MTAIPKPSTLRDPAYLKHLRGLRCCWCQRPGRSQAAHQGGGRGMSVKAPDDMAIPLCAFCHRLTHASFTPRNVAALAERFWARGFWGYDRPLTMTTFRQWAAIRARDLRAAYLRGER